METTEARVGAEMEEHSLESYVGLILIQLLELRSFGRTKLEERRKHTDEIVKLCAQHQN